MKGYSHKQVTSQLKQAYGPLKSVSSMHYFFFWIALNAWVADFGCAFQKVSAAGSLTLSAHAIFQGARNVALARNA